MKGLLDSISRIGLPAPSDGEAERVIFSNIVFLVTIPAALFLGGTAIFLGHPVENQIANITCALTLSAALFLNHLKRYEDSRILAVVGMSMGFALQLIFTGGYFAQSTLFALITVIVFVFFEGQPRKRLRLIIMCSTMFVLANIYLMFFDPIYGLDDMFFDEIVVFMVGLFFIYRVLIIYEQQKDDFLASLDAKNRNLESMAKEVERFAYIASHDLKSPLRTVGSFVGLIEKAIESEDYTELETYLRFVQTGVGQMSETIDDILALSKISSSNQEPVEDFSLQNQLDRAINNLSEEIKESGTKVTMGAELPSYTGQPNEFVQLFQNLCENAIKYNDSDVPAVHINWKMRGDSLRISVADNGIGIPLEFREKVFEFFERLHNNSEYPGTGLGLALCKKIAEKYEGKISVFDNPVGGSIFVIDLPYPSVRKIPASQSANSSLSTILQE